MVKNLLQQSQPPLQHQQVFGLIRRNMFRQQEETLAVVGAVTTIQADVSAVLAAAVGVVAAQLSIRQQLYSLVCNLLVGVVVVVDLVLVGVIMLTMDHLVQEEILHFLILLVLHTHLLHNMGSVAKEMVGLGRTELLL
jgi:hypothetical protein